MIDDNKPQDAESSLIDQFYRVISGYVEYCVRPGKTKLSDKDKEGLSAAEIAKKEEALKEEVKQFECQKKSFAQAFDTMCAAISEEGISALSVFVDAAKKLYEERADWKRDIKTMLVSPKSLKLFREARKDLTALYPLLMRVNKTFPVDDYYELSVSPKAALYGSEVNKTQKSSIKKAPLKNEEIQAMLDAFLQVNDQKRFGEWVMAILCFEPLQIVDGFQPEYSPIREKLKEWMLVQVATVDAYKTALVAALTSGNRLKGLLDAYIAMPTMKSKQESLELRIQELEKARAEELASHEERRKKQFELIKERDASISDLQQRLKEFERCKQQLSDCLRRYQNQIDINERLVDENERRLSEMSTALSTMQVEFTTAKERLEAVETEYTALQSDYSLKNNELARVKELAAKKEETARIDIMRELISGVNEQFFYLTMFYLELKETGKLEPETIELYADTLNNIDCVLMGLGIKKIGVIDQMVAYDASIHSSADSRIANGEQVMVSGYGWKIGDEIYIKAPVEKGE